METIYNSAFYDGQSAGSNRSARNIVPHVLKVFSPKSVLDVGCGLGTWLSEFAKLGVNDFLGIDGDYVERDKLFIPREKFKAVDLSKRFEVGEFDVVCCLEVAEHLPFECADILVASLIKSAPVVLFSAAIPDQGGTDHINEQWQSYWAKKFLSYDYKAFDFIRPIVRHNKDVEAWYRQNIVVYCRADRCPSGIAPVDNPADLDFVLPELYSNNIESARKQVDSALARTPSGRQSVRGLVHAVKRHIGLAG
ncbi:class I SAM-dependent methyltransferase [Bradyrhizobium sp. INPA01-394B]|uniref:Methyltransferase domain-containing protein n=1 Tax=Bradyrhizobium campsiandrae TaxID=1729892 RepID=A0ABR7UBY5_9BRAD|nr:methyltransferase domain-containing protein [Bradyrhizobium campsiandrae]MBC9882145.1 class I SAM-dependent methyltransferase [Bradyrhizobium campsiandrae]MBC9981031.1 methyltransferase domain-containing protein [Bradyrhizobium campsiandrae]